MKRIEIETALGNYPVIIGHSVMDTLRDFIDVDDELFIITDEHVKKHHLEPLKRQLDHQHVIVYALSETPEEQKNLATYEACINTIIKQNFTRQLTILAFGGGAVGDFAGYVAATYKRGVNFIQLPTTILAHDSSVGGKVAINHQHIKNIIGCFYAPKAVIYDLNFLNTLPIREIRSGFGEIIKHDCLDKGQLIAHLKTKSVDNRKNYFHQSSLELEQLLCHAIETKYRYIQNDVYDQMGSRRFLNLGHTLGHAIENCSNYPHGEAILFGLCFSIYLSKPSWAIELFQLFRDYGYFEDALILEIDALIHLMHHDKKNQNHQSIHFITLLDYGKPVSMYLNKDEFASSYRLFVKDVRGL